MKISSTRISLLFAIMTSSACFFMAIPLLPLYVAELDPSSPLAGPTLAISFFLSGLCAPLWGQLASNYGSKPMLIRSSVLICAAYGLSAYATDVETLFFSRCLAGIASGFVPVASGALAQLSPVESRNQDLAWITSSRTGGALAGPAVAAGVVWFSNSYRIAFLASALLSLITIMAALLTPNVRSRSQPSSESPDIHPQRRTIWFNMPVLSIFVLTAGSMLVNIWLPFTLARLVGGVQAAPPLTLITTLSALITMFLAPLWGKLADKYGAKLVLIGTLTATLPFVLALSQPAGIAGLILLFVTLALFGADTIGLLSSESSKRLNPHQIGPFFGWTNTATQYGNALGAAICPILIGHGQNVPIFAAVICDLIAMAIIAALYRVSEEKKPS
ncbi:MFS transporter [Austwickia chelonae]|uniref:MFS transporter n=1 Tax=Austwickia chelonae TaxID=100225 RepID=UPI000E26D5AA|nr:MFS transporter [Austwickia chelonae]